MSEDTNNTELNVEAPANTEPVVNEPQYTDVEKRAMEMGWVPKDQYNGDPDRWKTAEVFVALDEPIKRIESQSQEIKAVRKALEALQGHYSKVRETEYKRALDALKASRRQAYLDGDIDKVEVIENKIDEFKEQADQLKAPVVNLEPEVAQPAPEFVAWVNRNPWYTQHSYMAKFADELGPRLLAQGYSKADILKKVEEEVRKEFPNKFRNPNKDTAPAVEAGSNKTSGKKADVELTDQERNIMNTLVRSGVITKEKYIADLRKVKGLE